MSEKLFAPKRVMSRKLAAVLVASLTSASLLAACGKQEPVDISNPRMVLGGEAPWGNVNIVEAEQGCVEGELAWGDVHLCQDGNKITGDSPWGSVDVVVEADGRLTGDLPWGSMDVTVTAGAIEGDLPWGDVDMQIDANRIHGELPWGDADLYMGQQHADIQDPLMTLALVALMSDKT